MIAPFRLGTTPFMYPDRWLGNVEMTMFRATDFGQPLAPVGYWLVLGPTPRCEWTRGLWPRGRNLKDGIIGERHG